MSGTAEEQRESPHILIVEDHAGLRRLLRAWLGEVFPGDHLLDVSSGEEAVASAAADPPDLVLMDIQLPEMNGIEATRRIKAVAPRARVVMLSSMDDSDNRIAASAAGASAYVTKLAMRTDLIPVLEALHSLPGVDRHPAKPANPDAGTDSKSGSRRTRD